MTAVRDPAVSRIGPMPFAGGCAGIYRDRAGALQLAFWDEGWPDGAAGSADRPYFLRPVDAGTLAELDTIRAAIAEQVGGADAPPG